MMKPATDMDDAAPALELARNLPALVAQLKALREDMVRKSKLYDGLLPHPNEGDVNSRSLGQRESIFAPGDNSHLDSRPSLNDPYRQSFDQQNVERPQMLKHQRSFRAERDSYSVMWVSGECGISLRNFSKKDNKIGAQIAILQHVNGVTTGISNCRLGDQLVSINDEQVDNLRFREIVQKLKSMRRPISLGFKTNPNVQTSPRSSSSRDTTTRKRGNTFFPSRGGNTRTKATRGTGGSDRFSAKGDEYSGDNERMSTGMRSSISESLAASDRNTNTSVQSSSSTLSDDVELWCIEQEEMHSEIIVLLTETVMRCEKLQQENHDHLQNLMQLSISSPVTSGRSSAASSYSETETTSKTKDQLELDDLTTTRP